MTPRSSRKGKDVLLAGTPACHQYQHSIHRLLHERDGYTKHDNVILTRGSFRQREEYRHSHTPRSINWNSHIQVRAIGPNPPYCYMFVTLQQAMQGFIWRKTPAHIGSYVTKSFEAFLMPDGCVLTAVMRLPAAIFLQVHGTRDPSWRHWFKW